MPKPSAMAQMPKPWLHYGMKYAGASTKQNNIPDTVQLIITYDGTQTTTVFECPSGIAGGFNLAQTNIPATLLTMFYPRFAFN